MTQEQLRIQMLAGIITEGQYKAQLNENTFYQDMVDQNPNWDKESSMDIVRDEYDPSDEEDTMDHKKFLEDTEKWFDKIQSSGPTVSIGDKIEAYDRIAKKFTPAKIKGKTTLKGSNMAMGNVAPNDIPGWAIENEFGQIMVYPQYEEGKMFRKI